MRKNRWNIIHEDEQIIVIDKPANWSSVPDRFDESKQNIYKSLSEHREKVFMVHRLDRDTSGVMVLAKTAEAHKNLSEQFENREVTKVYHAFVDSAPLEDKFEVNAPIAYTNSTHVLIDNSGKESMTAFRLLERWKDYSLIECRPKSGRMHQIRIHLRHVGLPLIVDATYGTRKEFKISEIKKKKYHLKKNTEEKALLDRQTLHAYSLSFQHPETKSIKIYTSEYPKDLRALKNQLNKWNKLAD